jgi:hypothetical protein
MTETPSGLEAFCNSAEAIREVRRGHSTHRKSVDQNSRAVFAATGS